MANEPAKSENLPTPAPEKKKRSKSWVIVVVLMALEAAAVFFGTKFLTNSGPTAVAADEPEPSHAAEAGHGAESGAHASTKTASELAEVELSECRPFNRVSGKLVTFRMRVSALVKTTELEKAKSLVEGN